MKNRYLLPTFAVVITAAVSFGANALAQSFTEPSSPPPQNNADAPLDVSANSQSKSAGLLLNTGGATNGLLVQYGNVGIGTTTPSHPLTIDSPATDTFLQIYNSTAGGHAWNLISDGTGSLNPAGSFAIQDQTVGSGVTRFIIGPSGNVGINTTTPATALDVYADWNTSSPPVPGKVGAAAYCDVNGNNCIVPGAGGLGGLSPVGVLHWDNNWTGNNFWCDTGYTLRWYHYNGNSSNNATWAACVLANLSSS